MIKKDGVNYLEQFEFDIINIIDNDMIAPLTWNDDLVTFLIKDEKRIINQFRQNPWVETRKGLLYITYNELINIPIIYMYITINDRFTYKTCFVLSEENSKSILDAYLKCRNYNFILASSTDDISIVEFKKYKEILFDYNQEIEYDQISKDVFLKIVDAFNSLDNEYFLNILLDIENGTRSKYLTFHTNK